MLMEAINILEAEIEFQETYFVTKYKYEFLFIKCLINYEP